MNQEDVATGTSSPRCFVVGLGNIGGAIAGRLAHGGVDVVGVDMSAQARTAFEQAIGGTTLDTWSAASPADGDRVFLLVRTVEQAHEVLLELIESDVALTVYVMTTLDLSSAARLAELTSRRVRVIETPVSGGRSGASDGSLTMMLAGPASDTDRLFLLEHLAHHVVVFERYGQPTAAKLHNNVLAAFTARSHAEILRAGRRNGLEVSLLDEVLKTSSGSSWMGRHLTVVVDDLLEKDVQLFEESFGCLEPLAIGAGSGLTRALAEARALLDDGASGVAL